MKPFARCFLMATALAAATVTSAQSSEDTLIAVLKSDAPQQQKADACIELARVGSKAAVAPLAALLGDEKYAHMARYGLETIPDPAVDVALRAALGQLKGSYLVGVIQSIGVRRDVQAVKPLAALLADSDGAVAAAAAFALGKIGTPEAADALKPALGKVPLAAEGLLLCAESASSHKRAAALYDAVRDAPVSAQAKLAATRGAILTRGASGIPMLMELIRGNDGVLFTLALRVALELDGDKVDRALAAELGKLAPEKQIGVIALLAERGRADSVAALLDLVRNGKGEVRVAAVRAVTRLGHASAVPVLAELAVAGDDGVSKAALAALAGFSGRDVDAAIIDLVKKTDPKLRRMGLELIGRRRIAKALPEVLRLAEDADAQISAASLKVLGDMAGTKELPALIGLVQKTASPQAAEALASVCVRLSVCAPGNLVIRKAVYGVLTDGPNKDVTTEVAEYVKSGTLTIDASNVAFGDTAPGRHKQLRVDYVANGTAKSATADESSVVQLSLGVALPPPEVIGALMAAYGPSQGAAKLALLRVLCAVGGPEAFGAVRTAAGDASAEMKETAQRALCDWQTTDAVPDLEQLVQAPPNPKMKILALRGYVRLVAAQETAAGDAKAAALKKAFGWAERDEERRLVLASLPAALAPEALALAVDSLGNAALKDDACAAAVALAEGLAKAQPEAAKNALKKVLEIGGNEALLKRARECLGQIK